MAIIQATVLRTSPASQYTLSGQGTQTAVSSDLSDEFTLPTGFGDCLLLETQIRVSGLTTATTAPADAGCALYLVTPSAGAFVDLIGTDYLRLVSSTSLAAAIKPDGPIYWPKEMEVLCNMPAGLGASGNADYFVMFRVRRLVNTAGEL